MKFAHPTEFSFENMNEESAKKALSIVSSFIYRQEGGPEFLNQHLGQYGCTADGLINEILTDEELTRHELGQALHHDYHRHCNPDDEDAAEYQPPARIGGKNAHPFERPSLYVSYHPHELARKALSMHNDDNDAYAGLAIFEEGPAEENFFEDAFNLEAPEQEAPVADDHSNEEQFTENAFSDDVSVAEDFTTDASEYDNSDDDDYVETSAPKPEELTFEEQLALTIVASLKEAKPQNYNGEASGTNGALTPPPSQPKTTRSSAHSPGGKRPLPKSPSSSPSPSPAPSRSPSPAPVSKKRGRSTDDDDDSDDKDDKPAARPVKKVKKSAAASTSDPSSSTAAGGSGSSAGRKSKPRKGPSTTKPRRSAWSDKELKLLYDCLSKRREVEAENPNIPKLYDAPLWTHVSEHLAGVHGVNRTPGGCKSAWNRQGRQDFDFDERSALKRSAALATSVQTPKKDKKDKKGKIPAVKDDE
ncbi:hypothetical protein DSL72_007627 [Monilinia vaccinii-corymbosi]|uniref:Myb-like domain-containing protein n=1 Tax=Monilinia vaccinii-corymbosi TaxID=61207 RepID=A0A8A3PIA3_9HELO|nr:hypothetical protein DSL72_007627 [Monilinia vaccinii-corymbosi]